MAITDLQSVGPKATPGPTCSVCRLLADLNATEATALRSLLANPQWRYSALSDALAAEGYEIKQHMLSHHARGKCAAGEKLRGS